MHEHCPSSKYCVHNACITLAFRAVPWWISLTKTLLISTWSGSRWSLCGRFAQNEDPLISASQVTWCPSNSRTYPVCTQAITCIRLGLTVSYSQGLTSMRLQPIPIEASHWSSSRQPIINKSDHRSFICTCSILTDHSTSRPLLN